MRGLKMKRGIAAIPTFLGFIIVMILVWLVLDFPIAAMFSFVQQYYSNDFDSNIWAFITSAWAWVVGFVIFAGLEMLYIAGQRRGYNDVS
jgi:vacuolar-type H+-ATPase subunit I/STV1